MRILEFRAWDHDNHKMIYWTLNDLLCRVGDPLEDYGKDRPGPFFDWMQCTELKDKNGKLIYEGDVLWHDELDMMFVVKFGGFFECINGKVLPYHGNGYGIHYCTEDEKNVIGASPFGEERDFLVQGNIYESNIKELSKGIL
jgi:hypothetical protein